MSKRQMDDYVDSGDEQSGDEDASVKSKINKKKGKVEKSQSKEEGEDGIFELSDKRKVTVRRWGKSVLVDIREYYMDEKQGKMLPGKKGISLMPDQWKKLKSLISDIDKKIEEL